MRLGLHISMSMPARLLIIVLLAVGLCLPAVIGQQPGTVNIRPRVATAQPGVPTVKVAVDRNRVPLGDEVTFFLTPASVVRNQRFTVTIYFGDGAQTEIHQTEIVHLYRASGSYTYSVLVKPSASPSDPITQKPQVPTVKLLADPTTVKTKSPVNFTAQLSRSYPNIQYRFVFGDGSQTDWQQGPQTAHEYAAAKTYPAYVDIGEGSRGFVKRIGGSQRQPIQVIAPQIVRVELLARPASVKTEDTVRFNAQTNSRDPKTKYRFAFGDGAITGWQDSSETNHKYAVAGDYFASVEVGLPGGQSIKTVGTSKPARIGVAAGPNPKPSPSPRPSPKPSVPPSPSPTPLPSPNASPSPTSSTSPGASPSASPSATGTSSPTPDGNGGQTNSTSPGGTPSPSVLATPAIRGWFGSPDDWWKYLLLALLLIFLVYKAVSYFFLPRPKFVPNIDGGVSRVGAEKPLSIDLQMALDPNVTGGQYGIETPEGSLIKSERGSNG